MHSLAKAARWDSPVSELSSVNPARARALKRLGIETLGELILHFPKRHEDRARFDPIPSRELPDPVCLSGVIRHTSMPEGMDSLSRARALRAIHFPENREELAAARRHLVLEEFFHLQLVLASRRAQVAKTSAPCRWRSSSLADRLHASLPFPLTGAQKRVIAEIRKDLASPHPMNRLLQGDVGSGKTLVAFTAMLDVVEAGYQAALMAPTQILAEQHYQTLVRWAEPLGVRVSLRTGNRNEEGGPLPLFADRSAGFGHSPEPQIVVGTHALLYESVDFTNLGLVVIDEQHKFGVLQRSRLIRRGDAPDVLAMTATPIPRTLAMSFYGDLEVSEIDELPSGRKPISTVVRAPDKLPEAVKFLRGQLEKGRQAFVVYPLIDESETKQAKAATAEHEQWKKLVAPYAAGLLHGRMSPEEKDAAMERFRSGETRVLVTTTVVEVGVDVPNATVMLVENADRFGLAQLHQLRGRVGRGGNKSFCILLTSDNDPEKLEKIAVMERTNDGFVIAEEDLRIRGPGDILGTQQSGLPPLRLGDLSRDAALMKQARAAANAILRRDPDLALPEHQHFRNLIVESNNLLTVQTLS
jgi:ATP-dependent DNA helicase RecG